MIKGFLFDWIELQAADIAPGNFERTLDICPNFADSVKALRNEAAMSTGVALQCIIFAFLEEIASLSAFQKPLS